MEHRRSRLIAGGAFGALGGLFLLRRHRRSSAVPPELVEKAEEWIADGALPEHVRDVARRILVLSTAAPRTRRSAR